jgi:hypothetical protein
MYYISNQTKEGVLLMSLFDSIGNLGKQNKLAKAVPSLQAAIRANVKDLDRFAVNVNQLGQVFGYIDIAQKPVDGQNLPNKHYEFKLTVADISGGFIADVAVYEGHDKTRPVIEANEIVSYRDIYHNKESLVIRFMAKYLNAVHQLGIRLNQENILKEARKDG